MFHIHSVFWDTMSDPRNEGFSPSPRLRAAGEVLRERAAGSGHGGGRELTPLPPATAAAQPATCCWSSLLSPGAICLSLVGQADTVAVVQAGGDNNWLCFSHRLGPGGGGPIFLTAS